MYIYPQAKLRAAEAIWVDAQQEADVSAPNHTQTLTLTLTLSNAVPHRAPSSENCMIPNLHPDPFFFFSKATLQSEVAAVLSEAKVMAVAWPNIQPRGS